MDNLSPHSAGSPYEALPAPEAHRFLQRLNRRIGARAVLNHEVTAWQRQRNALGARIKWKFTAQKAREKLARAYPDTANESKSL